jgi:predicted  nucleic acid-binding Zn-ribbon protein
VFACVQNDFAVAHEAERVRGLKLEASKWKQALKDAEMRFTMDVDKVKAISHTELTSQFAEEKKHLENAHRLILQRTEEAHERAIEHVRHEHEHALVAARNACEMDKETALRQQEQRLKNELNQQWEEFMTAQIKQAVADVTTAYKIKLETEANRLENFKKDVQLQQLRVAEERNALQYRLDQAESLMKNMEASKKSDIEDATKQFAVDLRELEKKLVKDKKEALDIMSKQQSDAIVALEAKFKEETDEKMRLAQENMKDELEENMRAVNTENNRLLSSLEKAMNDLRNEKMNLMNELETTTTRLENTEDTLFDAQQEMKKRDKQHSIMTWRLLSSVQTLKINFRKGMSDFQQQAAQDVIKAQADAQRRCDVVQLGMLRLSNVLSEVEAMRRKINAVLVSYKTDVLGEKRTQIKLAEKELERICSERDAFEQERDSLEEEIELLEGQVRATEEQIREHNRASSMQNGRVNVAHARKKKRLDGELERLLDSIEQKRVQMSDLDESSAEKARVRDMKELQMVEWERELVSVLLEQQRAVLTLIEECKVFEERGQSIAVAVDLPWPAPMNPNMGDVARINAYVNAVHDKDKEK